MRHAVLTVAIIGLAAGLGPAIAQDADDAPPMMTGPYADFIPDTGLVTTTETPPETDLVKRLFTLAFTEACNWAIDGGLGGIEPEIHDIMYRPSYDEPTDPERLFRLYRFNCNGGAYNFSTVQYGWDVSSGLRPLAFARPDFALTYADPEADDSAVTDVKVIGASSRPALVNSWFDAASVTLSARSAWRGIGDASDYGVWRFRDGDFSLELYEVDGSYDGEVNPVRIVDYTIPGAVAPPENGPEL